MLEGNAADLLKDRHLLDEAYLGAETLEDDPAAAEFGAAHPVDAPEPAEDPEK